MMVGRGTSHSQLSLTYEHAYEALIISRTLNLFGSPLGFPFLAPPLPPYSTLHPHSLSRSRTLVLALWLPLHLLVQARLAWCKLATSTDHAHTHTRRSATEGRSTKSGKGGRYAPSTYAVRLKSSLMTMSITVCGRVRIYSERAERSVASPRFCSFS